VAALFRTFGFQAAAQRGSHIKLRRIPADARTRRWQFRITRNSTRELSRPSTAKRNAIFRTLTCDHTSTPT